MLDSIIAEIRSTIDGRTNLDAAVAVFTGIVQSRHERTLVFNVEAVRAEILYRLAVDIALGDRDSEHDEFIEAMVSPDGGYYDGVALLVAEHLGNLANEKTTIRYSSDLYVRD